jgi:hypothetical protein
MARRLQSQRNIRRLFPTAISFPTVGNEDFMTRVVGLLLILFGTGWLISEWPSTEPTHEPSLVWRRTAVGWEHVDQRHWIAAPQQPTIHPLLFSLALLSFALSGLIGFSSDESTATDPFVQ